MFILCQFVIFVKEIYDIMPKCAALNIFPIKPNLYLIIYLYIGEQIQIKKVTSTFSISSKFCFFAPLKYCKLCVNYHYY